MNTEHDNHAEDGRGSVSNAEDAVPVRWNWEADVLVVGAGAAGLAAAISARDVGASVIVVDANYDVGGHAILSEGRVCLGGGTSAQKTFGIEDSPDLVFADMTDWSIIQPNGWPDYRYNDRSLIRAFADNAAPTYEFLLANGVRFENDPPDNHGAHSAGNSVFRENHILWEGETGRESPRGTAGAGLIRPLENSARKKGVEFLLHHKMTRLHRSEGPEGEPRRVIGISASYQPRIMPGHVNPLESYRSDGNIENASPSVTLRAHKAVIIATGGSSSNVDFRRMFDPRLTEVYQVAGEPYSYQDASGEIAAMSLGASLWGLGNQILEHGGGIRMKRAIGSRYNYSVWGPTSPIFPLLKASGLAVRDWQNVILVNQVGHRFYDESQRNYPYGNHAHDVEDYVPYDTRNPSKVSIDMRRFNLLNAALSLNSGSRAPDFAAGPIWAIFDSNAVKREGWTVAPPHVDPDGYFFSASTVAELAARIRNPYQPAAIAGQTLEETVRRYNEFVETGVDADFGRTKPGYKIDTGPFYAAWATPSVHDTRSGLRINAKCQALDMGGRVLQGLYCGGESAGGITLHGLGRCLAQGFIAGRHAASGN